MAFTHGLEAFPIESASRDTITLWNREKSASVADLDPVIRQYILFCRAHSRPDIPRNAEDDWHERHASLMDERLTADPTAWFNKYKRFRGLFQKAATSAVKQCAGLLIFENMTPVFTLQGSGRAAAGAPSSTLTVEARGLCVQVCANRHLARMYVRSLHHVITTIPKHLPFCCACTCLVLFKGVTFLVSTIAPLAPLEKEEVTLSAYRREAINELYDGNRELPPENRINTKNSFGVGYDGRFYVLNITTGMTDMLLSRQPKPHIRDLAKQVAANLESGTAKPNVGRHMHAAGLPMRFLNLVFVEVKAEKIRTAVLSEMAVRILRQVWMLEHIRHPEVDSTSLTTRLVATAVSNEFFWLKCVFPLIQNRYGMALKPHLNYISVDDVVSGLATKVGFTVARKQISDVFPSLSKELSHSFSPSVPQDSHSPAVSEASAAAGNPLALSYITRKSSVADGRISPQASETTIAITSTSGKPSRVSPTNSDGRVSPTNSDARTATSHTATARPISPGHLGARSSASAISYTSSAWHNFARAAPVNTQWVTSMRRSEYVDVPHMARTMVDMWLLLHLAFPIALTKQPLLHHCAAATVVANMITILAEKVEERDVRLSNMNKQLDPLIWIGFSQYIGSKVNALLRIVEGERTVAASEATIALNGTLCTLTERQHGRDTLHYVVARRRLALVMMSRGQYDRGVGILHELGLQVKGLFKEGVKLSPKAQQDEGTHLKLLCLTTPARFIAGAADAPPGETWMNIVSTIPKEQAAELITFALPKYELLATETLAMMKVNLIDVFVSAARLMIRYRDYDTALDVCEQGITWATVNSITNTRALQDVADIAENGDSHLARLLQRVARGYSDRKPLASAHENAVRMRESAMKAVLFVQRMARGMLGRQRARQLHRPKVMRKLRLRQLWPVAVHCLTAIRRLHSLHCTRVVAIAELQPVLRGFTARRYVAACANTAAASRRLHDVVRGCASRKALSSIRAKLSRASTVIGAFFAARASLAVLGDRQRFVAAVQAFVRGRHSISAVEGRQAHQRALLHSSMSTVARVAGGYHERVRMYQTWQQSCHHLMVVSACARAMASVVHVGEIVRRNQARCAAALLVQCSLRHVASIQERRAHVFRQQSERVSDAVRGYQARRAVFRLKCCTIVQTFARSQASTATLRLQSFITDVVMVQRCGRGRLTRVASKHLRVAKLVQAVGLGYFARRQLAHRSDSLNSSVSLLGSALLASSSSAVVGALRRRYDLAITAQRHGRGFASRVATQTRRIAVRTLHRVASGHHCRLRLQDRVECRRRVAKLLVEAVVRSSAANIVQHAARGMLSRRALGTRLHAAAELLRIGYGLRARVSVHRVQKAQRQSAQLMTVQQFILAGLAVRCTESKSFHRQQLRTLLRWVWAAFSSRCVVPERQLMKHTAALATLQACTSCVLSTSVVLARRRCEVVRLGQRIGRASMQRQMLGARLRSSQVLLAVVLWRKSTQVMAYLSARQLERENLGQDIAAHVVNLACSLYGSVAVLQRVGRGKMVRCDATLHGIRLSLRKLRSTFSGLRARRQLSIAARTCQIVARDIVEKSLIKAHSARYLTFLHHSISALQALGRGKIARDSVRRHAAILKCQPIGRAFAVRGYLASLSRIRLSISARALQAVGRASAVRSSLRCQHSLIACQPLGRAYLTRRYMHTLSVFTVRVVTVQRVLRGHKHRRRVAIYRAITQQALDIQRVLRGYHVRHLIAETVALGHRIEAARSCLQRVGRACAHRERLFVSHVRHVSLKCLQSAGHGYRTRLQCAHQRLQRSVSRIQQVGRGLYWRGFVWLVWIAGKTELVQRFVSSKRSMYCVEANKSIQHKIFDSNCRVIAAVVKGMSSRRSLARHKLALHFGAIGRGYAVRSALASDHSRNAFNTATFIRRQAHLATTMQSIGRAFSIRKGCARALPPVSERKKNDNLRRLICDVVTGFLLRKRVAKRFTRRKQRKVIKALSVLQRVGGGYIVRTRLAFYAPRLIYESVTRLMQRVCRGGLHRSSLFHVSFDRFMAERKRRPSEMPIAVDSLLDSPPAIGPDAKELHVDHHSEVVKPMSRHGVVSRGDQPRRKLKFDAQSTVDHPTTITSVEALQIEKDSEVHEAPTKAIAAVRAHYGSVGHRQRKVRRREVERSTTSNSIIQPVPLAVMKRTYETADETEARQKQRKMGQPRELHSTRDVVMALLKPMKNQWSPPSSPSSKAARMRSVSPLSSQKEKDDLSASLHSSYQVSVSLQGTMSQKRLTRKGREHVPTLAGLMQDSTRSSGLVKREFRLTPLEYQPKHTVSRSPRRSPRSAPPDSTKHSALPATRLPALTTMPSTMSLASPMQSPRRMASRKEIEEATREVSNLSPSLKRSFTGSNLHVDQVASIVKSKKENHRRRMQVAKRIDEFIHEVQVEAKAEELFGKSHRF